MSTRQRREHRKRKLLKAESQGNLKCNGGEKMSGLSLTLYYVGPYTHVELNGVLNDILGLK